jgi:hypothetical protein
VRFVTKEARRLYLDEAFCRDKDKRIAASAVVAEAFPKSAPDVERLLAGSYHRLTHEVQFSLINMLDFRGHSASETKQLLAIIENFLMTVPTNAGLRAFVAGCFLGREFNGTPYRKLRESIYCSIREIALSARYQAGRYGALHALSHILEDCSAKDCKRMLDIAAHVFRHDRSKALRSKAALYLLDDYKGKPASIRAYARKLGGNDPLKSAKRRLALPRP